MSSKELLYKVEDGIATITFNRPERMNALTHDLEAALHGAFDKASGSGAKFRPNTCQPTAEIFHH